jgi:hypothetical protein
MKKKKPPYKKGPKTVVLFYYHYRREFHNAQLPNLSETKALARLGYNRQWCMLHVSIVRFYAGAGVSE